MVGIIGDFGSTFELKKLGQWMPWSINPDPELEAVLDDSNLRFYKNGLMNMSTGYGIGAVAYFRRVIENETQRLIDELIGDRRTRTR